MPGPRNKRKDKTTANAKAGKDTKETSVDVQAPSTRAKIPPPQCLTLEEDEMTRCGQPATEGYPKPERCKVHHGQYRILYKKYKDASEVVDSVKDGAELPTREQIGRCTDGRATLEKARWVRKYLEAIRVERAGRNIHQKRFFLKVDDGHRRRLKLLEREMNRAVEVLDALQSKAFGLYHPNGTLHAMNDQVLSPAEVDLENQSKRANKEILESIHNPSAFRSSTLPVSGKKALTQPPTATVGDEDLVDVSLRAQKEQLIDVLQPFIDFGSFVEFNDSLGEGAPPPMTEFRKAQLEKYFFVYQQFMRRIILQQETLFMKSLERVSFKDLILSDDFSVEDLAIFLNLFSKSMEFPLKWFKDAVLDALAMSRHGTAANVGSVENRFPMLGGWVFNRSHTTSMSNEAWWLLLTILRPPADVENRFVRLCNNFDDLIGFLSLGSLGFVPKPSFCRSPPHFDINDAGLSRNHLSLSGIIVADMVASPKLPHMRGPVPTPRRATRPGCIVWGEMETRAYLFGAIRNEPDPFVEAFLRELRARPDLFQVVLRSETAPGREVEVFGSGPSNNEALPAMRFRSFESPPSSARPSAPASTSGAWVVARSALDVLYGTGKEIQGYLTLLARDLGGWFFHFKTFKVRYFVILDTIPNRDRSVLARNVAWAALRAGGYAQGEYTVRKYAVASDKLFEKCTQERLGWMPKEMEWSSERLQDRVLP